MRACVCVVRVVCVCVCVCVCVYVLCVYDDDVDLCNPLSFSFRMCSGNRSKVEKERDEWYQVRMMCD